MRVNEGAPNPAPERRSGGALVAPGGRLRTLLASFPRAGRLEWIGLRPARRATLETPDEAELVAPLGFPGDRYAGRGGERAVTIVQAEHLAVIAALAGRDALDPAELRRNLVVSGINLLALKGRAFRVGGALLEHTGACHPCSRMEEALGGGRLQRGARARRDHGAGARGRMGADRRRGRRGAR